MGKDNQICSLTVTLSKNIANFVDVQYHRLFPIRPVANVWAGMYRWIIVGREVQQTDLAEAQLQIWKGRIR